MSQPTARLSIEPIIASEISFADYLRQYEGQATEWHAGQVVQKVTNNPQHNFILLFLTHLLSYYVDTLQIGQVLLAGVPMYIDDATPAREPDLMILLNENTAELTKTHLHGAPDIAIEIVSPGSSSIDRGIKFDEYEAAGVQEYWLIDPLRNEAYIYALNNEGRYQTLDKVDGKLVSNILEKFSLETAILWRDELPKLPQIIQLAQQMIDENN